MSYPNEKFRKFRRVFCSAAKSANTPEWLCYFIVDLIDDCMVHDTPGMDFCGYAVFMAKCRVHGVDEFVDFADMLRL